MCETETSYSENFVLEKHTFICFSPVRDLFSSVWNMMLDIFVDIICIVHWISLVSLRVFRRMSSGWYICSSWLGTYMGSGG